MGMLVGWVIAACCGALFVGFVFASFFIALLSMRCPPTAKRQETHARVAVVRQ